MLTEVTKEEVGYGYDYQKSEITQQVGDHFLQGEKAITTLKSEQWTRAVYTYGTEDKDSGILIMTMIEKANVDTENKIIDDFWKSLKIKK